MNYKYKTRLKSISGDVKDMEYVPDKPGRNWELVSVAIGDKTFNPKGFQFIEIWRLAR